MAKKKPVKKKLAKEKKTVKKKLEEKKPVEEKKVIEEEKPVEEKKLVEKTVEFELEAPDAKSVYLVGSFNKWDINGTPMKKDESGLWKTNIKLAPGTYEYLFHVDGQWQNDPKGTELKENPFGTMNNVLVVK